MDEKEKRRQRYEDEDWVKNEVSRKGKEVWIAYILYLIAGMIGGHRYYLGETNTAITMTIMFVVGSILTIVLVGYIVLFILGIWVLIDLFTIPKMVRSANERTKLEAYDELRRRKDALDY